MMDTRTAMEECEAISQKAIEDYRRDIRFRRMVDSCASVAMSEAGRRIDPDRADEEASLIARRAAMLVLARIYHEDAEIAALRMERDHYKKLAEEALLCTTPRLIIDAARTPGAIEETGRRG